jgi:hypothetical protein
VLPEVHGRSQYANGAKPHLEDPSFLTAAIAASGRKNKMALVVDNTAAVIKRDYLDIVTREDAAKYWQIMPATRPTNVIAMTEAT